MPLYIYFIGIVHTVRGMACSVELQASSIFTRNEYFGWLVASAWL